MKFRISLILAFAVLTGNVNAAVITRTGSSISFEGDMGSGYKHTEVQLQILGPFNEQKSIAESVFSTTSTVPVTITGTYINTVTADENGKYTFSYDLTDENMYYTIMVKEPDHSAVQYMSLYVPTAASEEEFLATVNSATSAALMSDVFENPSYIDIMKGNSSDFSKITDDTSKNRLAAEMAKGVPYSDFADFEKQLMKSCAILLTNTLASASDAQELAENKVGISASTLYATYNSFSASAKTAVFNRMLNNDFADLTAYMKKFDESVFLEKVSTEKYASNMTEIITSNQSLFGFDLTNYSTNANRINAALYGKNFNSMTAFKTALADAIKEAAAASAAPAQGGGGGGSSLGSGIIPTGNISKIIENIESGIFCDIANVEWAKNAINSLAEKGIVSGKGEGKFAPMDNIKREEFVQMIVKAFNLSGSDTEMQFDDVNADEWYFPSIKTAYSLGIINGIDGNSFGTGRFITRQDMAAIILRTARKLGKTFGNYEEEAEYFADDTDISEYAKEAVYALRNGKIIAGMDGNRFEPKSNATRAQAAVIIYALISNLK